MNNKYRYGSLFKKCRTDIIIKKVILNGHTLHVKCLEEILHQSAAILD